MDWTSCTSQLEKLDISPTQKANAFNFFSVAIELPAPSEMTVNLYDGGISLHWDRYELAVFADRYETYQFSDASDYRFRGSASQAQRNSA